MKKLRKKTRKAKKAKKAKSLNQPSLLIRNLVIAEAQALTDVLKIKMLEIKLKKNENNLSSVMVHSVITTRKHQRTLLAMAPSVPRSRLF